jgi:hypothetical protein
MEGKMPKHFKQEVEYHICTNTGRCAITFDDLTRATAHFNVVRYPGWKLVKVVRSHYDITPEERKEEPHDSERALATA